MCLFTSIYVQQCNPYANLEHIQTQRFERKYILLNIVLFLVDMNKGLKLQLPLLEISGRVSSSSVDNSKGLS